MLHPGASAPEIDLPDLDGGQLKLTEALERGPVVLVFFKIACPTCQMTLPFLQRLADSTLSKAQLVAISQDDAGDTREFQQRFSVSMPTVLDVRPNYPASNAYRIDNVPSIFLVQTDGMIALAVDGFHKAALKDLGRLFGVEVFRETDRVPELRPG
jgi:peroxiredoxin